jgi:hypothetical protein
MGNDRLQEIESGTLKALWHKRTLAPTGSIALRTKNSISDTDIT